MCISSISNIIFLSLSHPIVIRLCWCLLVSYFLQFGNIVLWRWLCLPCPMCVCVCLSIPLHECKCMRGPVSEKFSANFCPKIKQHWQEIVLASYAQLLPTCHCCPGIGRNIRSTCVRWSIRGDGSKCAVLVCVCVCACGCAKPLAGRSQREKFEGCR